MSKRITLLLVDDHALMRATLGDRLESEPDIAVVGAVENADRAVTEAIRLKPDIVLMDIDMPGLSCFDAAGTIQSQCPNTRIIFLSAFFHDRYIEQALAVMAAGYLTKGESPESVIKAVRAIASGRSYFSAEVQARLIVDSEGTRLARKQQSRASTLTPKELEVLRYLVRGLSQKKIARITHRSVKTVHNLCTKLMAKLNIHNRVELVTFAIREGLAEA